jgi:hypothetical protein
MKIRIDTVPDWTFEIDEISAGVYELHGTHLSGASINLTGANLDNLIENAKEEATSMQMDLNGLRNFPTSNGKT